MRIDLASLVDAKAPLGSSADHEWDHFVSAYNGSERVQRVFGQVRAARQSWWILPEYGYSPEELAHLDDAFALPAGGEKLVVSSGLAALGFDCDREVRYCFDITGFMRPQILYLMAYLRAAGVTRFDMLYTEPEHYARRAETRFSIGEDYEVRSVAGYIGAHDSDTSGDVLVLGVGYDHHQIAHALQAKEGARIIQLHSFPSLSADMYHESILRLDRIRSERPRIGDEVYYSSANDPFVVATSLFSALKAVDSHRNITNIYLSPLATKPQTVGFGLFFLRHLTEMRASIIYPNCARYDRETSTGVGRSWVYPIFLQ